MAAKRKSDPAIAPSRFRTERLTQDGGKWYFTTREGTLEGPFDSRIHALNQLDMYIRLAESDLLVGPSCYAMQA